MQNGAILCTVPFEVNLWSFLRLQYLDKKAAEMQI